MRISYGKLRVPVHRIAAGRAPIPPPLFDLG